MALILMDKCKTEWWFWDQMENLLKCDLCTNISIIRGQNNEVITFNSIKNQWSLKQLAGIVFNGEW